MKNIVFLSCQGSLEHQTTYKQECTVGNLLDWISVQTEVGIDLETEGWFDHSNKILTVQIGNNDVQYVVDYQTLPKEYRKALNDKLFSNPDIVKIFHNGKFDIKFLWFHGFEIVNVYDTMVAECVIHAGKDLPKGSYTLFSVAKQYCNAYMDKSIRGEINRYGLSTAVIEYAAKDVEHLQDIMTKQLELIKEHKLTKVIDLEMKAILPLAEIEYHGLKLDIDRWKLVKKEVDKQIKEVDQEITKCLYEDSRLKRYTVNYVDLFTANELRHTVNLSSPAQKLELLRRVVPDLENTSERVMSRYKDKYKIFKLLLEYNKVNKLKSSFTDVMEGNINPNTGRIHPDIWQILSTGRISFRDPNLQQIPSRSELGGKMREAFVPEKGHKIVGADYSGCELRIIADLSKDPYWINTLNKPKPEGDLHTALCMLTFDIDRSEVKNPFPFNKSIKYRDVQKTINFGLAYGMSEYKLADTIGVSVEQAREIIKKFFSKVPKVERLLEGLAKFGQQHGFIRTVPYGRIRWFDIETEKFGELAAVGRKAKNHPFQGGNADMCKLALVYIYEYIKENKLPIKIILQVHDEIQTECPEELAEEWKPKLEELMRKAAEETLSDVRMFVDATISDHWSK